MRKKKGLSERLVILEWEDAATYTNEPIVRVLNSPEIVRTFGILEHKDDKYHIIMTHDSGEDGSNDRLKVPTSLVRKITYLKKK